MRPHPVMARSLAAPGSLWLLVEGFSLRGRFIDGEGEILDDFEIRKASRATDPTRHIARVRPVFIVLGAAFLLAISYGAVRWGRRFG